MVTFAEAYTLKKRIAHTMLKHSKVQAVGIGYRDPKHPEKGAAVLIFADAFSPASLGLHTKLPAQQSNVHIRIVRTTKLRAHFNFSKRIRPVLAGYSIGTKDVAGTLGLIVAKQRDPSQQYFFSNNHVLTHPTNRKTRAATLQPGGQDQGRLQRDQVGRVDRFSRLKLHRANYIDAAISIPLRKKSLVPRYAKVGTIPGHVTSYRVGERFKKVGQKTGFRYGVVESVNTDVLVEYGSLGSLLFKNQTIVRGTRPISLSGDSGSVWLRAKDNYAAAVNFAGTTNGKIGVAFPLDWAMRVFRTRVARPIGVGRVRNVIRKSRAYAPAFRPNSSHPSKWFRRLPQALNNQEETANAVLWTVSRFSVKYKVV